MDNRGDFEVSLGSFGSMGFLCLFSFSSNSSYAFLMTLKTGSFSYDGFTFFLIVFFLFADLGKFIIYAQSLFSENALGLFINELSIEFVVGNGTWAEAKMSSIYVSRLLDGDLGASLYEMPSCL